MHFDVIIIGAGPGGLSCATQLARNGASTLVVERKSEIGPKVCAGGITWSGLTDDIPQQLIERAFPKQYIKTPFQSCYVEETHPIIATVNRKKLGQYMAQFAKENSAAILTSTSLIGINGKNVELLNLINKQVDSYSFDFLVGADGSSSMVRKHLELPSKKVGIGINYEIEGTCDRMEWHLNNRYFNNGYGWIFPHKHTISIGAYIDRNCLSPFKLKNSLLLWAKENGFDLYPKRCSAGLINYDFRGWQFDNIFLIGDAAGFASALTGEGIFPAIISGKAAAERIIHPSMAQKNMERLEKKQKRFSKMVELTSKSSLISSILSEIGVLALRSKIIDFTTLEMGK